MSRNSPNINPKEWVRSKIPIILRRAPHQGKLPDDRIFRRIPKKKVCRFIELMDKAKVEPSINLKNRVRLRSPKVLARSPYQQNIRTPKKKISFVEDETKEAKGESKINSEDKKPKLRIPSKLARIPHQRDLAEERISGRIPTRKTAKEGKGELMSDSTKLRPRQFENHPVQAIKSFIQLHQGLGRNLVENPPQPAKRITHKSLPVGAVTLPTTKNKLKKNVMEATSVPPSKKPRATSPCLGARCTRMWRSANHSPDIARRRQSPGRHSLPEATNPHQVKIQVSLSLGKKKRAEDMQSHAPSQLADASPLEKKTCQRCRVPFIPYDVELEAPPQEEENSTSLGDALHRMTESVVGSGMESFSSSVTSGCETELSSEFGSLEDNSSTVKGSDQSSSTESLTQYADSTMTVPECDLKFNKGETESRQEMDKKPVLLNSLLSLTLQQIFSQTSAMRRSFTRAQTLTSQSGSRAELTKKTGLINISYFMTVRKMERSNSNPAQNSKMLAEKLGDGDKEKEIKNSNKCNELLPPVYADPHVPPLACPGAQTYSMSLEMLVRLLCEINITSKNKNLGVSKATTATDNTKSVFKSKQNVSQIEFSNARAKTQAPSSVTQETAFQPACGCVIKDVGVNVPKLASADKSVGPYACEPYPNALCGRHVDGVMFRIKRNILVFVYSTLVLTVFAALAFPAVSTISC